MAGLDLDLPGLESVKKAVENKEMENACEALVAYYRKCGSGRWLRHDKVPVNDRVDPSAEKAARAAFPLPGGDKAIPRLSDGGFDWGHVPSESGGIEWSYGINRHDYMTDVVKAFFSTGNRKYVRSLDEQLSDWCRQVGRPEKPGDKCPWGTILEVGHRMKVWPSVFYGFQEEDDFSPATRILLLSQALDHAEFTLEFHSGGSNWIITEMAGLLSAACAWPEFRDAAKWRDTALNKMQSKLRDQVYPDGVQKELSSNYQAAVLWHVAHFTATARGAGLRLEPWFESLLENMWNYMAYSLGPNGLSPHNGDSDRCRPTSDSQVIKPIEAVQPIFDAAGTYNREDWRYIATNGAQGTRPDGQPSVFFPWAGQLIMRSGWDADAQWAFFDAGPWGILHQHNDALHLSVTAYGRDLLVDSGRYTYQNYLAEPGTWRSYFVNSASHNVILVDGMVQADGPLTAEKPIGANQLAVSSAYDFAVSTFEGGFADIATTSARLKAILWRQKSMPEPDRSVKHTRAVLYIRGGFWLVVDRIITERPRLITPLWHFHPECTVVKEGQSVVTVDPGVGNLRIQPIGKINWDIELVRGREAPDFQGWYSPEMDVRLPNTCACYSAEIPQSKTFAWLLLPAKGEVKSTDAEMLERPDGNLQFRIACPTGKRMEISLNIQRPTLNVQLEK